MNAQERRKKELVQSLFHSVQNMLIAGKTTGDKEIMDLGVTFQLVLLLAGQNNLEELKVFLKNYMLLGEAEKEQPMTRLLNMPLCLN